MYNNKFLKCLIIILLSTTIMNVAQAQEKFGEWNLICDNPIGAPDKQCSIYQNVVAENRKEVGLSVVVLKIAGGKAQILRVLAPLGVLIPNALGFAIDDEEMGRLQFIRCLQDGCTAETIMTEEMIQKMKKEKKLCSPCS